MCILILVLSGFKNHQRADREERNEDRCQMIFHGNLLSLDATSDFIDRAICIRRVAVLHPCMGRAGIGRPRHIPSRIGKTPASPDD